MVQGHSDRIWRTSTAILPADRAPTSTNTLQLSFCPPPVRSLSILAAAYVRINHGSTGWKEGDRTSRRGRCFSHIGFDHSFSTTLHPIDRDTKSWTGGLVHRSSICVSFYQLGRNKILICRQCFSITQATLVLLGMHIQSDLAGIDADSHQRFTMGKANPRIHSQLKTC